MPNISGATSICLKADFAQFEEGRVNAEVYPGMSVVLTNAAEEWARNVYAPGVGQPIMAVRENYPEGKTVDDAIASGENALFVLPKKGDIILVRSAAIVTTVVGTDMIANASGLWINTTAGAGSVLALDSTGGATTESTMIRVRVK